MNEYEQRALEEVEEWKRKIQKRSSILNRVSKKAQTKINSYIPDKVHQTITEAIKQMIQATLAGSNIIKKKNPPFFHSLQGKDEELTKKN